MRNRIDLARMARETTRRKRATLRPIEATQAAEREYRAGLNRMLRAAAKIVRERVSPAATRTRQSLTRDDTGELEGALGTLRDALEFQLRRSAEDMVERVLDLQFRRHTRRFSATVKAALGVDLSGVLQASDLEDEFALALRRNTALIKNLSDDVMRRVEGATTDAVLNGRSQKALATRLTHEFGVLQSRAKLIARDQTSKAVSDLNRLRQAQVGIGTYIWRTSRDERVRPSHAAKEGNEYRWDKPPADTGHPGEDVQCRCTAEAVIDL